MSKPEQLARQKIDGALHAAGWAVQDYAALNLSAARGIAVREFPLGHGFGAADYLLYAEGQVVGVIEAKREGTTLTHVEVQTDKYAAGIPAHLPAPHRPLPFLYQSTGVETRFTNRLDPEPRSRAIFHFHRPETLAKWISAEPLGYPLVDGRPDPRSERPATLRSRLQAFPSLEAAKLWPAQRTAVQNLEKSLYENRPRALIQMATGSGKTFTAITSIYRLIKYADATRVLFLVDRGNLGKQADKEFQAYTTPDFGRKFTELYNIQRLTSNKLDPIARVSITTVQRLYSMLKGEPDMDPALDEASAYDTLATLVREPVPVTYNPAFPVETFDFIFIDECHRSIYSLWRQVLEYFDAFLIGLTATPAKQTFGFFNQNLVMEYGHAQAVADSVNVDYDVYKIRTRITERGSKVEAGPHEMVGKRDRETRRVRWERLDDELTYDAAALDRQVVAPDQIRTIIRTFRDRLFTDIFPQRTCVPKTLIFAKDDSHADDIVQIVREEFGKGNDFCQKITYKTEVARIVEKVKGPDGIEIDRVTYKSSNVKTENLLQQFRTAYDPRIVVTVDMIATGTDVKPLEIVMFMRAVKSRNFFEQMKGRGVRVIDPSDLITVTPDAKGKDRFVLIDCVGICEQDLSDSTPLEKDPKVGFDKLLKSVAAGSLDPGILSSVAGRLARMDRRIGAQERDALARLAGGTTLGQIASGIVEALDVDRQLDEARRLAGLPEHAEPTAQQLAKGAQALLKQAVAPLAHNPQLRMQVVEVKKTLEQVIDSVSRDDVTAATYDTEARKLVAEKLVTSFREFIAKHKDEITALQVLYSRPYAKRLRGDDVKELAEAIKAPPRQWTPEVLWRAYEQLERDKVRGAESTRLMSDVVSLVRFALHQDDQLVPFADRVRERFDRWLATQDMRGRSFTAEQRIWLEAIRDHVAANLEIAMDDFEYAPFNALGGAGKAYKLFGPELAKVMEELNEVLAA
jgi:type I restriction enzyme R subunit